MVNEHGFDSRFVLDEEACLELGEIYKISVKFLNPNLAVKELTEGIEISLWEGGVIARGEVVKLFL